MLRKKNQLLLTGGSGEQGLCGDPTDKAELRPEERDLVLGGVLA